MSADPDWQNKVEHQATVIQGREYDSCLFGDSISKLLRDRLGSRTFNFALGGMSTVSLVRQLKLVTAAHPKCHKVIIAIGTNDAWYRIEDKAFVKNLEAIIALAQKTGAKRIILVPAFYATTAASHDPSVAGPNTRVDEINTLISEVGAKEQVGSPDLGVISFIYAVED